jgi:ribosomal protein S11
MILVVHIIVYRSNFFFIISNNAGKVLFVKNSGGLGYAKKERRSLEAFSSLISVGFNQIVVLKGKSIFFKIEGVNKNLLKKINKDFIFGLKKQCITVIGYRFVNTIPHNGCSLTKK